MIASGLALNEIIIVGYHCRIVTIRFSVKAELKKNLLSKVPKLRPSLEDNTTRLRSAVALVTNEGLV
jgi:uncharacterized protein YdhG (YjbR/CyaY superfamily)